MGNRLFIVVPAYNEEENIENFVNDWYPIVEQYGDDSLLVIINDGSKDNTYLKLKELVEDRPLLQYLTKENGGHGDTLIFGYNYAIENGADYVFQTDSDGQTVPSEFDKFWQLKDKYSAIFGNRTDRQDGESRKVVARALCLIIKCIFGVSVPDANAPFRLFNVEILKKYLSIMPEHYDLPNVILTVCCKYFRENIIFLPISFKPRQGGVNSINLKQIVKIGWRALSDFRMIRWEMKNVQNGED